MTDTIALTAASIFDGDRLHHEAALIVTGGRIGAIVSRSNLPAGIALDDRGDALLCPGFVDWQVNGGGGVLFNETPTAEGMAEIARAHLAYGTTALLPTVITDAPAITDAAAAAARAAIAAAVPGVVGIHFEGPHIAIEKRGAHDPAFIRPLEAGDLIRYTAPGLGKVVVTLAPENATMADITKLARAGVIVSLGHTAADYSTASAAFAAGASAVTHLFNAMAPLNHREPGLVGAAMSRPDIWCGLIADGHHVHRAVLRMIAAVGPCDRLTLVTDAMSTVGVAADGFMLNGRAVHRENGRLTLADGTLAGSDLDMLSAVRLMIASGETREAALRMASRNPARMLGLTDRGHFLPGARADILALADGMDLKAIWLGGARTEPGERRGG